MSLPKRNYVIFTALTLNFAVSNLTAEWIDNTTLEVKWTPVQVANGVSVTYIVYHSAMESRNGTMETEIHMSETIELSSIVIVNLDMAALYQITVMFNLNSIQISSGVGIGV